jgi:hypothetical protein
MMLNLKLVLIFISFMARDVENLLIFFFAIWTSSFETSLFSSLIHFFIGSLILLIVYFLSPCIF